jgi:hypothetical protein
MDNDWWEKLSPDAVFRDLREFWYHYGLTWKEAELCAFNQMMTGDIFEDYGDFADWTKTRRGCA